MYILRCWDGSLYVGHTDDLARRLAQHEVGWFDGYMARSRRHPFALVYQAEFATRDEAFQAERKVKRWSRAKKEALIRGDWVAMKRLARGRC